MNQPPERNPVMIGSIVLGLLVVTGFGSVYVLQDDIMPTSSKISSEITMQKSQTPMGSNGSYTNGEYMAKGNYDSPAGPETIDVAIVIDGNNITKATVMANARKYSATSRYQTDFIENFKQEVVGKAVDDIKLDRVAGSSLTSNGFNDALEKIKQEAS